MSIKNLSLMKKIIFSNAFILLFLVVMSATSYFGMSNLRYANVWVDHTHKVIQQAV